MPELPIVLTASISTRHMKGADFSDQARETMYRETLRFYVEKGLGPLVLVENSGWDLSAFRAEFPMVEFVSLDPHKFDVSRGKGYNEILLLNQALEFSATLSKSSAFLKVTGRYPVYNLHFFRAQAAQFILRAKGLYYGDMKDHKLYDWLLGGRWNGHAAYTVLFATTVDFYRAHLAETYRLCNDYTNDWIENVWYRVLKPFRGQRHSGVSLRFKREPHCGGQQGSIATTFAFSKSNESFKARLMRLVGNGIRIFLPWFWF